MNAIARAIGHRWFERSKYGWEWRLNWAEISGRVGLSVAWCSFEEHYSLHVHLGWPNIYFKMPFLNRWHKEPSGGMESWGFSLFERAIHLNWGRRSKIVHLPWDWAHVRHEVYLPSGRWVTPSKEYQPPYSDGRQVETLPFTYVLRNGTVQNRIASVFGDEREWRWRWLKWVPFPRRVRRSIEINFDAEVGEETGSWKGGVLGCGYEWRKGESMADALSRMERERKL